MTEILDDKSRAFAAAAYSLMQSDAFKEAGQAVEEDFSERWKTSRDPESRETIFQQYNGIREIMSRLRKASGDWEMHLEATKES